MLLVLAVSGWLCLVVTLSLLLRHFMRFIAKKTFSWSGHNGFIDLGEYATTWFATGVLTVCGFALYKFSMAFLAYLFSDDLIGFFIMMRGVFSLESTSQNPLIFEHLITGLVGKTLVQLLSLFAIYRGLRSFMSGVNERYKSDTYQEGDLLYYGFFASLLFIAFEIISYIQNIPHVSRTAHILYLAIANTSVICYFLALSHMHLMSRTSYRRALPRYLEYDRRTKRIIGNPVASFFFAWILGIILHNPLFLGTQFLESNFLVISFGLLFVVLFILVARKLLAKGFNYFGAIMFFDAGERIAHRSLRKVVQHNIDKYVFAGVVVLLLVTSPKSFGLLFIVVFPVLLVLSFLHISTYLGGLALSILGLKNSTKKLSIDRHAVTNYLSISGKELAGSVFPSFLVVIIIFSFISIFPKLYRQHVDTNFINAVYDKSGEPLLFDTYDGNACTVAMADEIPFALIHYLQLQEDRNFTDQQSFWPRWSNWHGFSPAAFYRMLSGTGGGSNLNMQLIKNAAFSGTFPRDFQRKYTEMLASYQLSLQMEPDEIIVHYLNQVGMNGGIGHQGAVMAAYRAFDRPLATLNELELLYLVTTLKRGTMFKARDRYISYTEVNYHREEVKQALLDRARIWKTQGLIDEKEVLKLETQALRFRDVHKASKLQLTTNEFLKRQISNEGKAGYRFVTTLGMPNQQRVAEAVKHFELRFSDHLTRNGHELYAAAIVVDVKTGNILGHYGGKGLSDLTTLSGGSPIGSIIKPFILLELMESLNDPGALRLYDGKVKGRFTPNNYSRRYSNRDRNINDIISKSLNAPMVNVRLLTDPIELFRSVEKRFAIQGIQQDRYLGLDYTEKSGEYEVNYPLGSRNMTLFDITQAYQTLMNDGVFRELRAFEQEYDPVLMTSRNIEQRTKRIFPKRNIELMKSALHHTMLRGGTGTHIAHLLPSGRKFYAKTGTSDEAIHGYTVLSDGKLLIVSYVTYGKVTDHHLELNRTPPIPFGSGVRSAGVLAALLYNEFDEVISAELAIK